MPPESTCAPLCGASKAYGKYDKPWRHEPQCPVRVAWEVEKGLLKKREFEGVVKLTWYGDECGIEVDDDSVDEHLIALEGKRVRITVEVLPGDL